MRHACAAIAARLVLENLVRGDGREKVFAIHSGRRSASPREGQPGNITAPKRFFLNEEPDPPKRRDPAVCIYSMSHWAKYAANALISQTDCRNQGDKLLLSDSVIPLLQCGPRLAEFTEKY
jgi:hypothetical protein